MNWYGNQAGEGFEYHLLELAMAAALIISGGGRLSFDKYLFKNLEPNKVVVQLIVRTNR